MVLWIFDVSIMLWLPSSQKKEGASMVNEFCPISLLNVVIKIITKVLVNKLHLTFTSLSIKPNRPYEE